MTNGSFANLCNSKYFKANLLFIFFSGRPSWKENGGREMTRVK